MLYEVNYYPLGCAPADAAITKQVNAPDLADLVRYVVSDRYWGFIADPSMPVTIGRDGRVLAWVDLSTGGVTYA